MKLHFRSNRSTLGSLSLLIALACASLIPAAQSASENPNNPDKICKYKKKGCSSCDEESGSCDSESGEEEDIKTHTVKHDEECPEPSEIGLSDDYEFVGEEDAPAARSLSARPRVAEAPVKIAGGFSANFVSPDKIKVTGQNAEIIRDADTHIRQVKGTYGLYDLVFTAPKTLEMRYYKADDLKPGKTGGLYVPVDGAVPLTITRYIQTADNTVRTENINNASDFPSLKSEELVQTVGPEPYTLTHAKTYYKGEGISAEAYKKVTMKITGVPHGEPSEEHYLNTVEELGSDGRWHVVKRKAGRRAIYDEKEGFVSLYECDAVDGNGNPLPLISTETTRTYYNAPLDSATYGKLRTLRRNDGYWENKYYEENPHAEIEIEKTESPWLNTAAHEPGASPNGSIRTRIEVRCATDSGTEGITETVDGIAIAKEWTDKTPVDRDKVKEIRHQPHSGGIKTTTTLRYRRATDIPAHLRGKPVSIEYATGEKETYTYQINQDRLTTTHDRGYGEDGAITKGRRTITTTGLTDLKLKEEIQYALEEGQAYWLSSKTAVVFDKTGEALKWVYNNNPEDYTEKRKDCCQVIWERGRDGAETTYTHDAAGRITSTTSRGITRTTEYKGPTTISWRQLTGSNERYLVARETRSLSGDSLETAAPAFGGGELVTTYSRDIPARSQTITYPEGIKSIVLFFADGCSQSETGTTGLTTTFTYTVQDGGNLTTTTREEGATVSQTIDFLGNATITVDPAGGTSTTHYAPSGQAVKSIAPDGETTLYQYENGTTTVAYDKDRNGEIDLECDTAVRSLRAFDPSWPEGTGSWKTEQQAAYLGAWLTRASTWKTEDGLMTRSQAAGTTGYNTSIAPPLYQRQSGYTHITRTPAGQEIQTRYLVQNNINTGTESIYLGSDGQLLVTYRTTVNPWGHVLTRTEPRIGDTTYTHDLATGLVTGQTTPDGYSTAYQYDPNGRLTIITLPDGTAQHTAYNAHGQITRQWGSCQYPVQYEYDIYGRQTAMYTYRLPVADTADWPDATEGDKTAWIYDAFTGQLARKLYADGNGPSYTYTAGGKLHTLTNARGTITTFQYDTLGRLLTKTAGDNPPTPLQTFDYDQLGNMAEACTEGVALYRYKYTPGTQQLIREDISLEQPGETSLHRQIHRTYDPYGRIAGYTLNNGPAIEQNITYTYNTAGQIKEVTADGKSFQYQYHSQAPQLLAGMEAPSHTVINTWETRRDHLADKTSHWKNKSGNGVISQYTYTVNSLRQRTSVTTSGEAFAGSPADCQWTYDILGQVNVANQDSYVYDQIGNRIRTSRNGQNEGYTATSLNQYTAAGVARPLYDLDGNLVSGLQNTPVQPQRSLLRFTWNADNRPVTVHNAGEAIQNYAYDHMDRRVQKGTTRIVYDGYNAIAEYGNGGPAHTWAWGLDLSGSMQGAGGVGGLLSDTDYTTQEPLVSYPLYDGNGNITQYITSNNTLKRHYEYDVFGQVLKTSGSKEYSYQFSTKPFDTETGLNYYNYRSYDSVAGRWASRDPINEAGGLNLYGSSGNNMINNIDYLGLDGAPPLPPLPSFDPIPSTTLQAPNLSYKTQRGPEAGECGGVVWIISWIVDQNSDNANGGQIIQDMEIDVTWSDCKDKTQPFKSKLTEAWRVNPGTTTVSIQGQQAGAHDSQDQWIFPAQSCPSKGKGTFKGHARYYPNKGPVDWLPGNQQSPPSSSGDLPSQSQNPKWDKTGASNLVTRTMTFSWDCCKEVNKTIVNEK